MYTIPVLILEDDDSLQKLIGLKLRDAELDYDLFFASTIAEPLRLLAERQFDLALIDLGLPNGRGLGTVSQIQSVSPDTDIIIHTGSEAIPPELTRGIAAVAYKPLDSRRLDWLVDSVMRKRMLRKAEAELAQLRNSSNRRKASRARIALRLAGEFVGKILKGYTEK